MISATNSVSWASATTHCVNTMPRPDKRDHADHDAGRCAGERDRKRVLGALDHRVDDVGQRDVDAGRLAQRRHREAGERPCQRGERRAVAGIHDDEQDDDRQEEVSALGHDDAQPRQLRARHADDAAALGLEMHRREAGDVVKDRRNDRPDDDLAVGHGQELGHHEGGRPHDRRHDLPAGRRGRLDAGGEVRLESPSASSAESRSGRRP